MKLYAIITQYHEGFLPTYHVVNMKTKKIESSLDSWPRALKITNELNKQNINTNNNLEDFYEGL